MNKPDLVHLKNGSIESRAAVRTVCIAIGNLAQHDPMSLNEFISKCQDDKYELSPFCAGVLCKASLINIIDVEPMTTVVHSTIRNVVLSGLGMVRRYNDGHIELAFVDPIMEHHLSNNN